MKALANKSLLVAATWLTWVLLNPSLSEACECIASGETKHGTIRYGGEPPCYSFWAEAGQTAMAEQVDNSTSGDLYPRVRIYDPCGVLVADSGSWDDRAEVECPLKKTGIYTLVAANGYGVATGDYELSLILAPGATSSPQDRDGGDMTISRTQTGTLSLGDLDAGNVYGRAGQGLRIEVVDLSPSGLLYPRVRVYDPHGVRLTDSGSWDDRAEVDCQLKEDGIYTIVVSNGYGLATGAYGLSVAVMPPMASYGFYPRDPQPADGNSVSTCGPVSAGWRPVEGATGYDVYFASSPCMAPEKVAENLSDAWMPMPELAGGGVYYWQVVAHTPAGDIQGPVWWFATEVCRSFVLALSATGQGLIVDPNVAVLECSPGEVVPVMAVADPSYELVRWEGSAVEANKVIIEYQDPTGSKAWVTVDGAYTLTAVFEEIVHDVPLDVDPGWARSGQWEFGAPTGRGGDRYGSPDPITSHTGQNVLGVNLSGDYDTAIGGPYSLVAGPFDLSGYEDIKLRFARWLNTDEPGYVTATVEVSTDERKTWQNLWESEAEMADSQWVLMDCPLGAEADGQPVVYVRWSYQVLRARAYPHSGWNLDDIQLYGRRQ